ncbi:MAG: hypothetical protein J6J12_02255 [Oscillospiraceae bacterium]|nr:hypothetical protein [Oscillospiraceae bacterium]
MKRKVRYLIYIGVFTALLLLLYLLLVLFATVPNSAITGKMMDSAVYLSNEKPYVFSEDGQHQNITDNLADQMWLNIGWHMGIGDPFVSALDTRYCDGMEYGPSMGLFLSVTRGCEANTDYTRYWHGTAGILRVLHLFTDIHGIRILGMVSLVWLLWRTLRILLRSGHWDMGVCLLFSLFWVQVWNLRLSVEYQPCFLICFGLCPAFLRLERRGDFYLNLLAIVAGTLTAFFDFLTTETITILIPLLLVVAIRSRECRLESPRKVLGMLLCCGICWALAYLGTFAVKWGAVSLATGENHFLSAFNSVGQRVNGAVTEGNVQKMPGMLAAVVSNLSVLFEGTSRMEYRMVIFNLIIIAILFFAIYRMYRIRKTLRPGTVFILLLGSIVLLRYSILANHSYLHSFFTYRALASTMLAGLLAMLINLRPGKQWGK